MPRPTEFRDTEYERQLAEFKARKAEAQAEQAASGGAVKKKVITESNWVSVKRE